MPSQALAMPCRIDPARPTERDPHPGSHEPIPLAPQTLWIRDR